MACKRGIQVIKFPMTWGLPLVLLVLAWASLLISSNTTTTSRADVRGHRTLTMRSEGPRCVKDMTHPHIALNSRGVPCIDGTRHRVSDIVADHVAHGGHSVVVSAYPHIKGVDVLGVVVPHDRLDHPKLCGMPGHVRIFRPGGWRLMRGTRDMRTMGIISRLHGKGLLVTLSVAGTCRLRWPEDGQSATVVVLPVANPLAST